MYGKNETTLLSRKIRQMSPAVAQVLDCFLNSCSRVLCCRWQTYFMGTNELYFGLQTNHCIKLNMEITLYYSPLFISILHTYSSYKNIYSDNMKVSVSRLAPSIHLQQSRPPLILPLFTSISRCVLVSWIVLLSGVALAFAGGHHSYLVGPRAPIVALQLDPLGPGSIDNTAPLLSIAAAPVPPSVSSTNPVGQQLSWQTLPSTHQLLDRVDTGALAIRDVLRGPQLPAAHLALVWP